MERAIGYIRVSTSRQASEGVSLESQRQRIEAWALANGYSLADIFTDAGISGRRADKREGFQAAISAAIEHRAALVVYSLSRFARNTREALEYSERLEKGGANLVSLSERIDTTTAAGKMVFRVLSALAEFESDIISERVSENMQYAKAQGRRVGAVPYGYSLAADGKHLVENEAEQNNIRLMRELRSEGLSLRQIAAELESRGIVTKTGKAHWTPRAISLTLKGAA